MLSLQDIDSINIGKVLIKRIDEKIIKELPLYIENPDFLNVSLIKQEYFNPIRFIQEFKGKTLFEVTIDGYQVENEKSDVFDKALKEFKYVLSYFSTCNTFLRNVGVDKYSIETEKIKLNNTYGLKNNYQIYYLKNNKKANVLKVLNILSEYIALPDFRFIIDKALFEKIKKSCSLKNFNLIFQNDKFGEIGNKIKRSLDWVYKEMLEKDETDKAIALFISLETLITYGKDPLIGLTDEYAENIAIMTSNTVEKRYKEKKFFKNKIYSLRCKIMHNGIEVKREQDWNEIHRLKIYVAWTLHWFIRNIYTLTKDGNCTEEMKKYFEREKLK